MKISEEGKETLAENNHGLKSESNERKL